jgi:glycyl-tRNA synthetase
MSVHSICHPQAMIDDSTAVSKGTVTLRERDTTGQLIGPIDEVIATIIELCNGTIDWSTACDRLPAYDGVQAVE